MKCNYWLDGRGEVSGIMLPTIWVGSRKRMDKYADVYDNAKTPEEALVEGWKFKFSTRKEAGTVAYMIARAQYMNSLFKVPMPEQFEDFTPSTLYDETPKSFLKLLNKFKAYEKYVPLYQDKWLGETIETHDK